MNREYLMLAHNYDPKKHFPNGWFASEKLDGMRAFWDGGISRGKPKNEIPWANTAKDERYQEEQIATGLWSRYGNVIHAPDKWLNELPAVPLDGELYVDVSTQRQEMMSIVKKLIGDESSWEGVRYFVFDMVPLHSFVSAGRINNPNLSKVFTGKELRGFDIESLTYEPKPQTVFMDRLLLLSRKVTPNDVVHILKQIQLPTEESSLQETILQKLDAITDRGGEGLILKSPMSLWQPIRSNGMVKMKPMNDDEATVIGYNSGQGKYLGMMGSLILKYGEKTFELSGFTDEERTLTVTPDAVFSDLDKKRAYYHRTDAAKAFCLERPGERCPSYITSTFFPIGSQITFRYRTFTREGIPQEARYWRKHTHY